MLFPAVLAPARPSAPEGRPMRHQGPPRALQRLGRVPPLGPRGLPARRRRHVRDAPAGGAAGDARTHARLGALACPEQAITVIDDDPDAPRRFLVAPGGRGRARRHVRLAGRRPYRGDVPA